MLKYLKKYWFLCLIAPLFMLMEISMDLIQPDMMRSIVDDGVLKGNMSLILNIGWKMLLLILLGGLSGVLCGLFASVAAQKFGNDVRKDLFSRIMDLSFEQTDRISTGSLITRLTNDVTQVQHMVMMSVRSLIRSFFMFVGAVFMLYRQAPRFAIVAALGLPLIIIIVTLFLKKASPFFTRVQSKLDRINCIMQENIAGARVVKAYVKEEHELETFSQANNDLCQTNLRVQSMLAFMHPCINIVLNICIIGVLYLGGKTVQTGGDITPGQTMAAITYITQVIMPVIFLAHIFQVFTRAAASWRRIKEVLDEKPIHLDGDILPESDRYGEIVFEHVSFSYPDAPENCVLDHVSFKVNRGETLAIIGATGSGKSTIAQLIPRFYDVTEGGIYIDGVNVKDYPLKALRDKVGIVMQKAELFSRSINENILWGKEDASDDEIQRAAEIAHAHDFIIATPEGYQALVAEGGHSLSGGQKQRISIARSVLKAPEILILDDSSSALDLKTEAELHRDLNTNFANTTKVIIAQRIASVKNANRILVLDGGRIAAVGTHDELINTSEIYGEIANSQLKREVE